MSFPNELIMDPHWDFVKISENVVFLDNVYGQHRRVKTSGDACAFLLRTLSSPTKTDELFSLLHEEFSVQEVGILRDILDLLLKEGVLRDYQKLRRHDLIDDATYERFATEITWLTGIAATTELGHLAFLKIRQAKVCLIGLGGAGSLLAQMLAAAGVGHLVLVDGDVVEDSNLSRQILYTERAANESLLKVSQLTNRIRDLTKFTEVSGNALFIRNRLDAAKIMAECDVVVLTADTPRITIQREVNASCVDLAIPLIYSLVGQIGPFFIPGTSACFRCLETKWQERSGAEHDRIVSGYTEIERREGIPATVLAAVTIANALCSEVIAFITGVFKISTINTVLRFEPNHRTSEEPCPRNLNCSCSRSKFRRRP